MAFRQRCVQELEELFNAIEQKCGADAVTDCLIYRTTVTNSASDEHSATAFVSELPATCLSGPLRLAEWFRHPEVPDDVRRLLRLYIYAACIEVRYVYAIVGNLLAAYGGDHERPGNALYELPSADRCFRKIVELHKKAGRRFALIEAWGGFLAFDLRKAISHSDYSAMPGGGVMLVRNVVRGVTGTLMGRVTYPPALIEQLYEQARDFLMAFRQVAVTRGTPTVPRRSVATPRVRAAGWYGEAPTVDGPDSGCVKHARVREESPCGPIPEQCF